MTLAPGTAARLVAAFEELVEREAIALDAQDYETALQAQQRAEPVVTRLLTLAGDPALPGVRARLEAVLTRRAARAAKLREAIAQRAGELAQLRGARGRLSRLGPAYGSRGPAHRAHLAATA